MEVFYATIVVHVLLNIGTEEVRFILSVFKNPVAYHGQFNWFGFCNGTTKEHRQQRVTLKETPVLMNDVRVLLSLKTLYNA